MLLHKRFVGPMALFGPLLIWKEVDHTLHACVVVPGWEKMFVWIHPVGKAKQALEISCGGAIAIFDLDTDSAHTHILVQRIGERSETSTV